MKLDWDYFWSMAAALLICAGVVNWEPKWTVFGYVCVGAMILRTNVRTIAAAIREGQHGKSSR